MADYLCLFLALKTHDMELCGVAMSQLQLDDTFYLCFEPFVAFTLKKQIPKAARKYNPHKNKIVKERMNIQIKNQP